MTRIKGIIQRLHDKGFGFIAEIGPDGQVVKGATEAFFHRSVLKGDGFRFEGLEEKKTLVEFEDEPDPPKGRRASAVFPAAA